MKLNLKGVDDSYSSPHLPKERTPKVMPTAAETTFSPDMARRSSSNVIKFNESLRQYITRIYGASVNPFIEANYNSTHQSGHIRKTSNSLVRKVLQLKGESQQPSPSSQFNGRLFRILDADSAAVSGRAKSNLGEGSKAITP